MSPPSHPETVDRSPYPDSVDIDLVNALIQIVRSNLDVIVLFAATAGTLVGVAIATARTDIRAARQMSRFLLAVAIVLPFVLLLALVAQPAGFSAMFYESPWYQVALPWAGAIGYLTGLGWMIRIYRADPEPGETTWRYRP